MDEQPLPIKNQNKPIVDLIVKDLSHFQDVAAPAIIEDLWKRKALGISRYGRALQAHNGRDAFRDAYEEAMDLCVYLRQLVEETPHDQEAYEDYQLAVHLLLRMKRRRGLTSVIKKIAEAGSLQLDPPGLPEPTKS